MLTFLEILLILLGGVALIGVGIEGLIEVEKTDSLVWALVLFLLAMIDIGIGITAIAVLFIL
ncbi:TPA: hypothetical protein IXN57_000420 [Enterococcus faecium]|uniref:hypothetical protein n=1 Tax=Enterococcus faecium TaxID=1352 RepID=UPI00032DCEA1|nr:hypothetical protein [Enterococcus faecium]EOH45631.1 hypothetical protein SSI_01671 [Enterococcus faecium EnGen0191]HAQ3640930.1 hypothetical protein [Enterococcus faecium]